MVYVYTQTYLSYNIKYPRPIAPILIINIYILRVIAKHDLGGYYHANHSIFRMKYVDSWISDCQRSSYSTDAFLSFVLYLADSLESFLDLSIVLVPRSLTYISSHDTTDFCYSAHFNDEGRLLLGCSDGLHILSSDFNHIERTLTEPDIISLSSTLGEHAYFFIKNCDGVNQVLKSTDLLTWEKVFAFDGPKDDYSFLAVSSLFIAVISEETLIVYNRETRSKHDEALDDHPIMVLYDYNGDLLVLLPNELRKYYVHQEGSISLVWRCSRLYDAGSLTITRYGVIVVQADQHLHLISAQGKRSDTPKMNSRNDSDMNT